MHCPSFLVILSLLLVTAGINAQNVKKEPSSSNEYFFRGLARHTAGELDGAIADFTKSIELDEAALAVADSDKIRAGLAESYCERGQARLEGKKDVDRALADFDRALVPLVIVADRTNADFEIRSAYSGGALYTEMCAFGGQRIGILFPCKKSKNLFGHLSVVNVKTGARVWVESAELQGDSEGSEAPETSFISPFSKLADKLVEGLVKKIGPRRK